MTFGLAAVERSRLLHLELETLWVLDADGRIERVRVADGPVPPVLAVAGHPDARVWAASTLVPAALHGALGEAIATAAAVDAVGWAPPAAEHIVACIRDAGVGPLAAPVGGPSWRVPATVRGARADVELRTSRDVPLADPLADPLTDLAARLPEADRDLTAPWVVALVDDEVAAVCETARSAPASVEAGVWTYAPHRRQGLASAVVAAWAGLVTGRVAFYSTDWDNTGSQGVARRLGLEPLGHWWQLHLADSPVIGDR